MQCNLHGKIKLGYSSSKNCQTFGAIFVEALFTNHFGMIPAKIQRCKILSDGWLAHIYTCAFFVIQTCPENWLKFHVILDFWYT